MSDKLDEAIREIVATDKIDKKELIDAMLNVLNVDIEKPEHKNDLNRILELMGLEKKF